MYTFTLGTQNKTLYSHKTLPREQQKQAGVIKPSNWWRSGNEWKYIKAYGGNGGIYGGSPSLPRSRF